MLAGWCAADSADGLGGPAVLMMCASPPEAQLCAAHLGAGCPRHPRPQGGLLPSPPRLPPPAALPLTRGRHSRRWERVSRRLDASGQTCLPTCHSPGSCGWVLRAGGLRALQGGGAGAGPESPRLLRKLSQLLQLDKVSLDPHH